MAENLAGALCTGIEQISSMTDKKRTGRLDWDDLRYFAALARNRNLAATARALRVNHATVARRVERLETSLGQQLLERRADGHTLTAAGRAILRETDAMEHAAQTILRQRDANEIPSGLVRLTVARVLADGFLVDRLGGLRERFPKLGIEVIAEGRVMSLSKREADIALRFGRPKDSSLVARRAGTIGFGFYASRARSAALAEERDTLDIGFDEASGFVAEAAWSARQFPGARIAFRSNSQAAQAAAARAGYGVALLPHYLAAGDPRLAPVALASRPPDREVWLLARGDLLRTPRVRAVADYLIDLFRRERALLEGVPADSGS
jgi:DNA-binding transcriptional LysR family regulator